MVGSQELGSNGFPGSSLAARKGTTNQEPGQLSSTLDFDSKVSVPSGCALLSLSHGHSDAALTAEVETYKFVSQSRVGSTC